MIHLPRKFSLRDKIRIIKPSDWKVCMSYALAYSIQAVKPNFQPSAAYLDCVLMRSVRPYENGIHIGDAMSVLEHRGCLSQRQSYGHKWGRGYKPITKERKNAELNKFRCYQIPQTLSAIKRTILRGQLVTFYLEMFDDWYKGKINETGDGPMPRIVKINRPMDTHGLSLAGWNDYRQRFIFPNGWGKDWGDNGWGTIPYKYVLNKKWCTDFWTIALA